ncbi:CIA30 family protein [Phormidium tenue FACHB-886]|nr:CIA30 family protein [Phormidium tenue FACHB-886]
MSQSSRQWDLGRFVKTLSYYGAVPLLSSFDWFQQWFGSRPDPTVNTAMLKPIANPADPSRLVIFDFTKPSEAFPEIWGALDDVVMGGVSQSGIQFGTAAAYFSGTVSTENSGGFASIRTRDFEPPIDLSNYQGIELRIKGDGNRYKFMLRTETRWDGIAYCYSFDTVADEWMTVQVPFAALVPVFRAKTVSDRPFALNHVTAVQLMLSKFEYDGALNPKFQPGFFQLQIESIQAYSA